MDNAPEKETTATVGLAARAAALDLLDAVVGGALLTEALPGATGKLDPADRARFAESGLGHLLAVSGLHLAILCRALVDEVLRVPPAPERPPVSIVAIQPACCGPDVAR